MKKKIILIINCLVVAFLIGITGIVGGYFYFSSNLPKITSVEDYIPSIPSQILSKDGTVLAEIGRERRYVATIDEIPSLVLDAFLAAEDDQFFNHSGVDLMGVIRAAFANLKAGRVVQGGSTITQQVAKSFLTRERSYVRKIKDMILAQRLESNLSKKEILFLYLNQVYFGSGFYGVKAAARGYFGKELSEVTHGEAALLAGLLTAPAKYSPYKNPKYAIERKKYVLRRLFETKKISEEEYKLSRETRLKFKSSHDYSFKAGYFTDWVRQTMISRLGEEEFLTQGFTINTTLDYQLQVKAEKYLVDGIKDIDKRQGFKGPLSSLSDPEEVFRFNQEGRVALLKSSSDYFEIDENFARVYQYDFDEEGYIRDQQIKAEKVIQAPKGFFPANVAEDTFSEFLKVGESYKGVVRELNSRAGVIFAEIGGLSIVIPKKGFEWAKKRVIVETPTYSPPVSNPNHILKQGDVVLIKIQGKGSSLASKIDPSYYKRIRKNKKFKEYLKQKYIVGELDQEAEVQSSLVSVMPKTGEILSFVGGADFKKSKFNRVLQAIRQPGSSFKPFIYATALENGYTPASILVDSPEALTGTEDGLNWKPRNYDGKYKGPITLRTSLELSRNITTIKLAEDLGVDKILEFTRRIGLNAEITPDLSLSLGAFGISLLDIVKGYGVFMNRGKKISVKAITRVIDRFGNELGADKEEPKDGASAQDALAENEIKEPKLAEGEKVEEAKNPFTKNLKGDRVYDSRLSYLMTQLLRGVVQNGTGRSARYVSSFVGGKTGTTNNFIDAWFVGFSPLVVTGVWTGFDNNKTMGYGEGGSKAALPIWSKFMKNVIEKFGDHDFLAPSGIVNVLINKQSGQLATGYDKEVLRESFIEGDAPGTEKKTESFSTETDSTVQLSDDDYYDHQ